MTILAHPATRSLVIQSPDPFALRDLLPSSRSITHTDYNLAVKHTLETTKILRNIGMSAPAPIRYDYAWPGKFNPYAHQIESAEFLTLHKRAFVLSEMGTGKTSSTLWAADWLIQHGHVHKVLIMAPLSTLDRVWKNEVFDTLMHRIASVVHGTQDQRLAALDVDADFYILNHDGVTIKRVAEEIHRRPDIDLVILDEASMFRNHDTKKYKALVKMLRDDQRLWLLTGTPTPNAPTDAWALARLVNPSKVPPYLGTFRRQTMMQISQFKWVPRPEAYTIAYAAMQPAVRFRKKDCIDLPPVVTEERSCELTTEQRKMFEEMRKEMQVESRGAQITAVNAADKINKIRQILCIAKGTLVLTYFGWVKIEQVTPDTLVWDGCEWVSQAGVVFKGMAETVVVDGVNMTPEHEVLTVSGWATAREILRGDASNRFDRPSVRLPDGDQAPRYDNWIVPESYMAVPMLLREAGSAGKPEPASEKTTERKTLRLQTQTNQPETQYVVHPPVQDMDTHETSVFRPYIQRLEKLRCAWNNGLSSVAKLVREFLERHADGILRHIDIRANRQQRRVCSEQLSVGNSNRARQQHTCQPVSAYTRWYDDAHSSGSDVRVVGSDTALPSETWVDNRESFDNASTEEAVYDLIDCGPRQRFTVCGASGELLIVHNCGAIKDPVTDTYMHIPHEKRLGTLLECIEQASAKVLVVVPFKGIIYELAKEVGKKYSVGVLNGDVSLNQRNEIIAQFKHSTDPHVLLCHPKVMSHGLNLTEADTLVFYAPIYSNDESQQVVERFNRPGQKNKMTVIRLGAHKLEWDIYRMVEGKRVTQESILSLYKSITE